MYIDSLTVTDNTFIRNLAVAGYSVDVFYSSILQFDKDMYDMYVPELNK